MLVMMKAHATAGEIREVCRKIEEMGYKAHPIPGSMRTAIGITGNRGPLEPTALEALPGVAECVPVSKPYKLVARELKEDTTVVDLGDGVCIGGPEIAVIAGPCAVESRSQAFTIARAVSAAGARLFRGGAYKPRTSPYSFQGLGEDGLKILADIRAEFGLKIVTEAVDHETLELVEQYGDVIQIGARNMQNFSRSAHVRRPHKKHSGPERRAGRPAIEPSADSRGSEPRHRPAGEGVAPVACCGGSGSGRPDSRSAPQAR